MKEPGVNKQLPPGKRLVFDAPFCEKPEPFLKKNSWNVEMASKLPAKQGFCMNLYQLYT